MTAESNVLLTTAAVIGVVHTVLGPDHYVPFVAMAKARSWTTRKALLITLISGLGHVSSSVVLGLFGLTFGVHVLKLEALEAVRGDLAGWLLLGFGLVYMTWGIRHALHKRVHRHSHAEDTNLTPWLLFTIFVFGPCEPLIPVLMYPAITANAVLLLGVLIIFSCATIGTMLILVYGFLRGLSLVPGHEMQTYRHALAGATVAACGCAITLLGL